MRLSRADLNRTLLARQHLLRRSSAGPRELVEGLVGLQAQDPLPAYLSLAARLEDFDPRELSAGLADRSLVRLVTLRGTIHLHTAADALQVRAWTQPVLDAEILKGPPNGLPPEVAREEFEAALAAALTGPTPLRQLEEALATRFPSAGTSRLGHVARNVAALAQVPPRGLWKQAGGVVYEYAARWTGLPEVTSPDVPALVRRYLRAFGPATASDVTAWSGVRRLGPVLTGMDDLVRHEDEDARVLFDVPDGPVVEGGEPAPVRLLGTYDNLWLAHQARDRVTTPVARQAWMGRNGGLGSVILVDGWLTGLWKPVDGRVQVVTLLRTLSPRERAELDDEIARVETLLAVE